MRIGPLLRVARVSGGRAFNYVEGDTYDKDGLRVVHSTLFAIAQKSDHGRHRGSRRDAQAFGGALGRHEADCYCVGADDTRRGGGGSGGISRDTTLVEVKFKVIKSE